MPLEMQTTPTVPNAIYFPQIIIQTGIVSGQLKSSAIVSFSAAQVNETGQWADTGQTKTILIQDIENLDPDLVHLAPQVAQLYSVLITLLDDVNTVRKVM